MGSLHLQCRSIQHHTCNMGWVFRYAKTHDHHKVLWRMLARPSHCGRHKWSQMYDWYHSPWEAPHICRAHCMPSTLALDGMARRWTVGHSLHRTSRLGMCTCNPFHEDVGCTCHRVGTGCLRKRGCCCSFLPCQARRGRAPWPRQGLAAATQPGIVAAAPAGAAGLLAGPPLHAPHHHHLRRHHGRQQQQPLVMIVLP
jgi:hypothetical protein